MKLVVAISMVLLLPGWRIYSQEIPPLTEQQLETLTASEEAETEDDSFIQALDHFRRNPLNLNTADINELEEFSFLSSLQIDNLLAYRKLLGNLLTIYELQAVSSWDLPTIRKLLPYIIIADGTPVTNQVKSWLKGGDHVLLLRASQSLERSAGYENTADDSRYQGSPQKILVRYRYNYKNALQYGITAEKDAGEKFLSGAQRAGFDFYSLHFFLKRNANIQVLAIGDYTVNLGQGLIHWQGLAFKKSAEVLAIKRQAPVLRPYSSAGEFYFHRGVALTFKKRNAAATVFVSRRKLDASLDSMSVNNTISISSFRTSGYHRNEKEAAQKNNIIQTVFGSRIEWRRQQLLAGVNSVYYNFSLPIQKKDEPYNLYAIAGRAWFNISIDYSYTWKNIHFFGELAVDRKLKPAILQGILLSADPKVDISLVYRKLSEKYQSVYGNAFTESARPSNETGIYMGISVRPLHGWKIDAYADVFCFPWLRYQADASGGGNDFHVQLTYTPNKQTEISSRFMAGTKQGNITGNTSATNQLAPTPRHSWRTQLSFQVDRAFGIRNRMELVWLERPNVKRDRGYLINVDFIYRPVLKPYGAIFRWQYFETGGFDTRIYAYENDVLYNYSIPAFYGQGHRYYLTINYKLTKKLTAWLRLAQSSYTDRAIIGSGLDEISGRSKTDVTLQFRLVI